MILRIPVSWVPDLMLGRISAKISRARVLRGDVQACLGSGNGIRGLKRGYHRWSAKYRYVFLAICIYCEVNKEFGLIGKTAFQFYMLVQLLRIDRSFFSPWTATASISSTLEKSIRSRCSRLIPFNQGYSSQPERYDRHMSSFGRCSTSQRRRGTDAPGNSTMLASPDVKSLPV